MFAPMSIFLTLKLKQFATLTKVTDKKLFCIEKETINLKITNK